MEIRSVCDFFDDAGADDKIAEVFTVKSFFCIAGQKDAQFAQNFFFTDIFSVQFAMSPEGTELIILSGDDLF